MMRIGVDLGGTKTESILLDGNGKDIARKRVNTPRNDYAQIIQTIVELVHEMEQLAQTTCSIGVATPGALCTKSGLIKNANSTCLNGKALDLDLESALRRPVRLANDANCFALSEAMDGAGSHAEVVFGVILGTGVGGGVVINKNVLLGKNCIAGEWGHNPLPWPKNSEIPGPQCYCGRYGCIETFLSGPALTDAYDKLTGTKVTAKNIANSATHDDHARLALSDYANRLARSLAQLINILDPDVIVLGGGLSNMIFLYDTIPVLWNTYIFSDHVVTELKQNQHGDSSGVCGAARLWNE